MSATPPIYTKARRHLSRRDPAMKQLIARIGACTLCPDPNGFGLLVRSIISQQISTKAAASIRSKLEQVLAPNGIVPERILQASVDELRSAGLSASKVRAVRDLSEKVVSGALPLDDLPQRSDEEVISQLIPVFGIGRWTAEMFLIFSLGRLDVLPVDDLGLRVGVQKLYGHAEQPAKKDIVQLAEPWRPYRSIATWYFWRSLGGVPQSK